MSDVLDTGGMDDFSWLDQPMPAAPTTLDPSSFDPLADEPVPWEPPAPSADAADLPNFDPATDTAVAGEPGADMALWHMQEAPDTCAVVSQEFILEALTGQEFDEAALAEEAGQNGWYEPGGGTPMYHMDSLLEAHGVATETHFGGTVDQIAEELESGNKVMIAVDSSEVWEPGTDPLLDDLTDPMPGQGADHAVEVTGIVDTPDGRMVVLNDPGHPDGRGSMVPVEEFEAAWADSDSFMVVAGPAADDSIDAFGAAPAPAAL